MHMADALLSPAVGGTMWLATAGAIAYASRRLGNDADERLVPLMGALGAFVFTAQMINFTIPGTGSSGHLVGGLLLAVLLGPHAAFLTISSVLVVQALFFADGGLLSLGCNILNLGFVPAYVAYPFVFRRIAGDFPERGRLTLAVVAAAVWSLVLGACGVVLETTASGISALPFRAFITLMLPVHLLVGIVEGVVTAALLSWLLQARPDLVRRSHIPASFGATSPRRLLAAILGGAILTGGVLSWYASEHPDGLDWTIARITGKEELQGMAGGMHRALAVVQGKTAFFPGYSLTSPTAARPAAGGRGGEEKDGSTRVGTSATGLIGGGMTLAVAFFVGFLTTRRSCTG